MVCSWGRRVRRLPDNADWRSVRTRIGTCVPAALGEACPLLFLAVPLLRRLDPTGTGCLVLARTRENGGQVREDTRRVLRSPSARSPGRPVEAP